MEKHRCKLCFKSFVNGRVLGGHMRSHMMKLCVPPKTQQQHLNYMDQLGRETGLASSSSSSDEEKEDEERESLFYGLRENPKKYVRLVEPESSFAGSTVLVQDRESETESSKNPIRRRPKRIRKSGISDYHHQLLHTQNPKQPDLKKSKPEMLMVGKTESEPVSSISDTSPEEDVAYCLMMLSRDKWKRDEKRANEQAEGDELEESDRDSEEYYFKSNKARGGRGKYTCETCFKVFRSYQALGGHRASHKKPRVVQNNVVTEHEPKNGEKVHECPFCFRIFSSGQALGGHKRSHVTAHHHRLSLLPLNPNLVRT